MISLHRLFLSSLFSAAALLVASCAHAPVPAPAAAHPPAPRPAPPAPREFDTHTPFVLSGGLDDFAARDVAQVRRFDSLAELRRFAGEGGINFWPIGRFAADALPRDAAAFAQVLSAHAAAIGADYVAVLTAPEDIQEAFPTQSGHLLYGALAYRRVSARIGLNFAPAGPEPAPLIVAGFVPGSRAEADGIRVGDVIESVDGAAVKLDNDEYWIRAVHWQPGRKVRLKILRAGAPLELDVTLTAVE